MCVGTRVHGFVFVFMIVCMLINVCVIVYTCAHERERTDAWCTCLCLCVHKGLTWVTTTTLRTLCVRYLLKSEHDLAMETIGMLCADLAKVVSLLAYYNLMLQSYHQRQTTCMRVRVLIARIKGTKGAHCSCMCTRQTRAYSWVPAITELSMQHLILVLLQVQESLKDLQREIKKSKGDKDTKKKDNEEKAGKGKGNAGK